MAQTLFATWARTTNKSDSSCLDASLSHSLVSFLLVPNVLTATQYAGFKYKPNKRVWGGARHGGNRRGAPAASLRSRWVRIFSLITGSPM